MILLVQPFSMYSPSGGARILRSVLATVPEPYLSVCTSPRSPVSRVGQEVHLPIRPSFGRVESTRFGGLLWSLAKPWSRRFRRRLAELCTSSGATTIHAIPHGLDFWEAYCVARELRLRYVINVHDELDYNLRGRPDLDEAKTRLGQTWLGADGRLVISPEMGEEVLPPVWTPAVRCRDRRIGGDSVRTTPPSQQQASSLFYGLGACQLCAEFPIAA